VYPEAEFSTFVMSQRLQSPNTEMTLSRTNALLYGEYGLVNDPANFEIVWFPFIPFFPPPFGSNHPLLSFFGQLAANLLNDTLLAPWGLDGGRGALFVRYANSLVDTYSTEFLQGIFAQVKPSPIQFLFSFLLSSFLCTFAEFLLSLLGPFGKGLRIFEVEDCLGGPVVRHRPLAHGFAALGALCQHLLELHVH